MRDQKSNMLLRQPLNQVWLEDDDNRIDWDRKSQKKRQEPEGVLEQGFLEIQMEQLEVDEVVPKQKKRKPSKLGKRDKRRQLVMDETSGRVRVKQRRKTNRNPLNAWLDEYE